VQDDGTRYVMGPGGVPLESVSVTGSVTYYYQDQLGSTRALLNGAGQAVGSYTYSPYGTVYLHTGSATTPFGFAGQYTDAESGLQYLRARYYDPATQQFLTRDPLAMQTQQPYAYAADNPLNGTDPTGLCGEWYDLTHRVLPNGQCVGLLTYWTEVWAYTHPAQAQAVAQFGQQAQASATQWVDTTPEGQLFNSAVIGPVCTLQSPTADWHAKARAGLNLAMLGGLGPLGDLGALGELGAAGDAADLTTSASGDVASNAANAARLSQKLTQEEFESAFTGNIAKLSTLVRHGAVADLPADVGLNPEVVQSSQRVLAGTQLNNPAVLRQLTSDGSNIADWGKYTSQTIKSPNGPFQIHFYYNRVTGAVNTTIDYKIVYTGVPR
jgi:RHS repeat-associated protein